MGSPRLKTLGSRVALQPPRLATMQPDSWRTGKTTAERGYDNRWKQARERYLRLNPLCVFCQRDGRVGAASVVDHMDAHRGDMAVFWDESRWQGLCKPHHDGEKQRREAAGEVR